MADDNENAIRKRAYSIWEAAGRPDGQHEAHWHQAIRELGLLNPVDQLRGTATRPSAENKLDDRLASNTRVA